MRKRLPRVDASLSRTSIPGKKSQLNFALGRFATHSDSLSALLPSPAYAAAQRKAAPEKSRHHEVEDDDRYGVQNGESGNLSIPDRCGPNEAVNRDGRGWARLVGYQHNWNEKVAPCIHEAEDGRGRNAGHGQRDDDRAKN